MDFNTYRPLALRTAKMFPTPRENMRHAALGLTTELGEFATEVKRHAIYGREITEPMRLHMIEEIGDAMWYVPLGLLAAGADHFEPKFEAVPGDADVDTMDLADLTILAALTTFGAHGAALFSDTEGEDFKDMVGAFVWLVDNKIAPLLGITGDQIRAENIEKLRARFPDAYSDHAAEARADKGGLPATES